MDAFKLLSRSTKLRPLPRPDAGATTPKQQELPSRGEAADPRIYKGDVGTATQPSKKRKLAERSAAAAETFDNDLDLPGELDFFGDWAAGAGKKARKASQKAVDDAEAEATQARLDEEAALAEVDPAESRRILKSHKIKVAQLWSPASESQKVEGEKEKRRKKKKHAVQVEEAMTKKEKRKRSEMVVEPLTSFHQLRAKYKVHPRICENLASEAYETPTEVQMGGLPLLLRDDGPDVDMLSVAPTGSGKTLAFLIPLLNAVKRERSKPENQNQSRRIRAVILAPTKELASQIVNEGRKLALKTGVQITLLRKGMKVGDHLEQAEQTSTDNQTEDVEDVDDQEDDEEDDDDESEKEEERLPAPEMLVKADVVVSTPMTMVHALTARNKALCKLSTANLLVLDEADVLLDPLFREQTFSIWAALPNPQLRVSLWSATMGASIEDLAMSYIADRWTNMPSSDRKHISRAPIVRIVIGLKDSAIPTIHHKLVYAATEQGKLMGMRQILRGDPGAISSAADMNGTSNVTSTLRPPFLVFTQTIARAVALHAELLYDIPPEAGGSSRIAVLHSDLSESARGRVMTRFRKGEIWVLITTDLLSRGVDFRGINGVVNYDFPNSAASYVHRVGRTGRAGRLGGVAVTLYAKEDIPYVKNVANIIATSERLQQSGSSQEDEKSARWLLEMLPKVSKREKQRLKRTGVESRRTGKEDAKTRISTKSSYDRRLERKKKGYVRTKGAKSKTETGGNMDDHMSDASFGGFE